ncbi:MAG: sel1 repeat family protein [Xanthobacteraceae bacterium]|nr:sel1 repeat family protein [Xanthobacteraceae bacterium]
MFFRARKADNLQQRVTALQAALQQCSEIAGRWTAFRRRTTVAIAVLMLALGFALGAYREPIHETIVSLAQAVGVVRPASALDAVQAAYRKGDYETVLRLGRPLAEAGDARAQSILGLAHYRGRGGVPQDLDEAARWFRQAADQGDATAQFYLGLMYAEGRGVPQSYTEAAKWYRLAAERGEAPAQYNLALLLSKGEVGAADHVSAYFWFNLAAARFPSGDPRRAAAVAQRDLMAGKMAPGEIAIAQRWAREWKPTQ